MNEIIRTISSLMSNLNKPVNRPVNHNLYMQQNMNEVVHPGIPNQMNNMYKVSTKASNPVMDLSLSNPDFKSTNNYYKGMITDFLKKQI